jgi:hypothetical protein
MSTVRDSQGNILNAPGPGCGRYTDANSTEIDWFATHPRPVEVTLAATVEFHATKSPATLPPNSGDTLKVVEMESDDKLKVVEVELPKTAEIEPTAPVAEALSAGVTTSVLPQTAVIA